MITIPRQLQNHNFRFLRLREKDKKPIGEELKWQENNYKYNDEALLNHLKSGGNYGIIGGYNNLILIDADSPEIEELAEGLIETFTIKTGSPESYKKHYFFITDRKMKAIRLTKEKVGDLGDVRSVGQYVVAPNSIHPKGGKYEIIKDFPIQKISVQHIKNVFEDYLGAGGSEEFKEYPISTTKRSSNFVRNCLMPDYCINNKLKGNTSKNWELFPYLVDILHTREVSQSVYVALCKNQGHNVGAIKGWVKKAHEGKLMKCSCEKMKKYIETFHPDLIDEICGKCSLNEKKPGDIFTKQGQVQQFEKIHPVFYDLSGLWWLWNDKNKCWRLTDEVDILNMINETTGQEVITSKNRTEILNALKQEGRKNIPKPIKPTWIQFSDLIVDIETGERFEASPKYFVTNPIPWNLNEDNFEDTPVMDRIFEEWVGKDYVKTLYEIIAYSLLPDYPMNRLFCFIGGGMNGKSKFLELLRRFVGPQNVSSTELDLLLNSRFEITRLHKKLVCVMGETDFNVMSRTSIIKKLTGGDLIGFEYKGKNPFEEKNYAKIIIATNNLPTTTDKTLGFYRRWLIIDFPNQFSEKKDILKDIPEEEYNSLALKCCGILKDLLNKRGFHNEGSIQDRMEKYEAKSDFLQKFLDEFTAQDVNSYITKADFSKKFMSWSEENRHRKLAENTIGKKMREKGIETSQKYFGWAFNDKGGQIRVWEGIKWKI